MSEAFIVFVALFAVTFLINVPIPLGMLVSAVGYFLVSGDNLRLIAAQSLGTLYTNYSVLAVPLFIFAANVMNSGKVTDMIFDFSKGIVGRFRGGLAHVNVLASLIFSGMTGSAIADAAGLGKMEIAAMRREKYDDGFSCAITAASATIGPIFPPSIPMVIFAMLSGTSIGALFMGGMIPGILLAVALVIYIAVTARRRNYPRSEKVPARTFISASIRAIPALFVPIILLIGIYTGIMTPTEAGAVAGLYALFLAIVCYRSMGWKGLYQVLVETVKSTGGTAIMVGAAACISFIIAKEQVAVNLGNYIIGLTENKYIFLLIVNIAFLVLGMFLDVNVIMLVFVPIVLPLVQLMGIDLVHFGLVIVFNMMLGLSTPPYGMLLFVVSGISDTPLKRVVKEIIPMNIVMLIVLLLITYFPDIVLFFPRLFMNYAG